MAKKTGIIAEFKEFIARGSVIDLAVGVIIGSAFTAIVNSLVDDIVMPVIGVITGGIDFSNLKYVITPDVGDTAESAICYCNFLKNIINFLLIAIVVFIMVKFINKFHRKNDAEEPATEPEPAEEILLLREIRDSLKK